MLRKRENIYYWNETYGYSYINNAIGNLQCNSKIHSREELLLTNNSYSDVNFIIIHRTSLADLYLSTYRYTIIDIFVNMR